MTKLAKNKMVLYFKQSEAHAAGDAVGNKVFVACDNTESQKIGAKQYGTFRTIEEFNTYFDSLGDGPKHFYEQLRWERPEYYDIDGKVTEHDYWKNSKETILQDFIKERANWLATTDYDNAYFEEDQLFVMESQRQDYKKSFHIIIRNGYLFKDASHQREYVTGFYNYLKKLDTGLQIDKNPYGTVQCIRTLGSCKHDPTLRRDLIRSDFNPNSLTGDRRLFFASYIEPEYRVAAKAAWLFKNKEGREVAREYLKIVKGFVKKVKKVRHELEERIDALGSDETIVMFNHLDNSRWDEYKSCLTLIWLAKSLGLEDLDIHSLCNKSEKYDEDWVQSVIESGRAECPITIGTLIYYLKEDCDADTLRKIIPREKTFEEIKKIPKNKRTKQQQEYFEGIVKVMVMKSIKRIIKVDCGKHVRVENVSAATRYVKDIEFTNTRSVAIRSCMGSGKTQACIRLINSVDKDARIVVLSPRITFANSICAEYNTGLLTLNPESRPFRCYTEFADKKSIRREKRIIVSMESLHYLTEIFDPDYLIIDECEANLNSHISNTNGNNLDSNLATFRSFLDNPQTRVVWADAFLGEKTTQFIEDIGLPTAVYHYQRKMELRKAYRLPDVDSEVETAIRSVRSQSARDIMRIKASSWWKLLCRKLDEGERVYFPSTTRKKVELVKYLFNIRYPEKKGLFYVGQSKGAVPYDFSDVNATWGECDLVMTTTTITVGINFNIPAYFNCIIMYFSSQANNIVADMIQCHYRVRKLIDSELYYYVNDCDFVQKTREKINLQLSVREKWYRDAYKQFTPSAPAYLKNLAINIINEAEQSKCNMTHMIELYLTECNYELLTFEGLLEEAPVECAEIEDDEEADCLDEIIRKYMLIPELSISAKRDLENKRYSTTLTAVEEKLLQKFYFVRFFDSEIDPQHLTTSRKIQGIFWYFLSKKYQAMKILSSCRLEKMLNSGEKSLNTEAEKRWDKHSVGMLHGNDLIKMEFCKEILDQIGFDHINDTSAVVDSVCMMNLFQKYKGRYTEISTKMNLQDQRADKSKVDYKNFIGLIKKVLGSSPASMCSFKVRKTRKRKVNGKRVSDSTYGFEVGDKILTDFISENPDIGFDLQMIPVHLYNMLGTREEVAETHKRLIRN
jgi:hypothetical protein